MLLAYALFILYKVTTILPIKMPTIIWLRKKFVRLNCEAEYQFESSAYCHLISTIEAGEISQTSWLLLKE